MARKRRGDAAKDEPTAQVFAVWLERGAGKGWVSARAVIPRSVLEEYLVEVSQPDLRGITVGRVVTQLERHAMDGGE